MGAEVSAIHRRVYSVVQSKPKIGVHLQTANGSPLQIDAQVKIFRLLTSHNFYIARNLNSNILLGLDWLQQNVTRIYFDLGALHLGDKYAALEDQYISSIARIAHPIMLRPSACTHVWQMLDYGMIS